MVLELGSAISTFDLYLKLFGQCVLIYGVGSLTCFKIPKFPDVYTHKFPDRSCGILSKYHVRPCRGFLKVVHYTYTFKPKHEGDVLEIVPYKDYMGNTIA